MSAMVVPLGAASRGGATGGSASTEGTGASFGRREKLGIQLRLLLGAGGGPGSNAGGAAGSNAASATRSATAGATAAAAIMGSLRSSGSISLRYTLPPSSSPVVMNPAAMNKVARVAISTIGSFFGK